MSIIKADKLSKRAKIVDDTPWARARKNVKKPPGEKGRKFRKEEMFLGVQMIFLNF